MNVEASKDFAIKDKALSTSSGLPTFLQTVIDAGHGVGTHCNDVRAFQDPPVPPLLPEIIAANKVAVDATLDDAANNVSISGICSRQDWVVAAEAAGFKITDAVTGLCYLSTPESAIRLQNAAVHESIGGVRKFRRHRVRNAKGRI